MAGVSFKDPTQTNTGAAHRVHGHVQYDQRPVMNERLVLEQKFPNLFKDQ